MKKFKVSLAVIALVIGVVSASAFKKYSNDDILKSNTLTAKWFVFTGTPGQELDPTKYQPFTGGNIFTACPNALEMCAIFAEEGEVDQPDITAELQSEIQQALSQGQDKVNVQLRED